MHLCDCAPGPLYDTAKPDRRRCHGCKGFISPVRPGRHALIETAAVELDRTGNELISIGEELCRVARRFNDRLGWAQSLAVQPTKRPQNGGRGSDVSDPTGNAVANPQRILTARYVRLAGRLALDCLVFARRALQLLQDADEAAGMATLVSQPGAAGQDDGHHTTRRYVQITVDTPAAELAGSPNREAHAALIRRHQRGEKYGEG